MIKLLMLDGSEIEVSFSKAMSIRSAWVLNNYDNPKQKAFINNLAKIQYSPEETYCLHRHTFYKKILMRNNHLYMLRCPQCGDERVTDKEI